MSRRRTRRNDRRDDTNVVAEKQFMQQVADEHVEEALGKFDQAEAEIEARAQETTEIERDEIDAAASEDGLGHPEPIDQPAVEVDDETFDELAAGSEAALFSAPEIDIPPFDPEIFERGALAAGIRMLEALLTQAKAGYINEQIDELARVLDVDFPDPERFFLGQVAVRETTASGLPDVAGAYQALIRAKAQVA